MAGGFGKILAILGIAIAPHGALSAEIRLLKPSADVKLITVSGKLEFGDEKVFANMALQVESAIVVLNSPGGNLKAGIAIGEAIRLKQFVTLILPGDACASACALAWLAGRKLFMAPKAKVGFHAASVEGETGASGPANALVGAYLAKLGMTDAAIVEMTVSGPDEMTWFTSDKARKLGIRVEIYPPSATKEAELPVPPTPAPPTGPLPAPTRQPPSAAPSQIVLAPSEATLPPGPSAGDTLYPSINLALAADVRRIQNRLVELGFLPGPADGTWGARSRVALRELKRQNGLEPDDRLGADAGSLLLEGNQAKRAANSYVLPDPRSDAIGLYQPVDPPAGARFNPLNPKDALAIQERLDALGYYRRTGDGTWGEGSRVALADFAVVNGLTPRDGWSVELESAVFASTAVRAAGNVIGTWIPSGSLCADAARRSQFAVTIGTRVTASGDLCFPVVRPAPGRYLEIGDTCSSRSMLYQLIGGQLVRLNPSGTADSFNRCDWR